MLRVFKIIACMQAVSVVTASGNLVSGATGTSAQGKVNFHTSEPV